jgi:HSP20 family protein
MAIIRWTQPTPPMRDLVTMHEEMNRLFDSAFGGNQAARTAFDFAPVVDIEESPEQYEIHVDLPGCTQKDVKVHVMGDTLTIRGERRQETREKANALRSERVYGTFERSFTLPQPVRADQVRATFKDGVLDIAVPKAEEARLREIEVKVG